MIFKGFALETIFLKNSLELGVTFLNEITLHNVTMQDDFIFSRMS